MAKRITELTEETSLARETDFVGVDSTAKGAKKASIRALLGTGWAYYKDSTYTSGSPLAVNNAKVQLECDGLDGNTNKTELPVGVTDLWDSSTNKITPVSSGDSYDLRVDFTADPTNANDWLELILDIGDGSPDIPIVSTQITMKINGANKKTIGFPIFSLSTFLANGGKIYFDTSSSGDSIDIYDIALTIKRDYAAE